MTVRRTQFDNGLTLLVEESHSSPVVALQAWVHAGSADESDDIAGVAHLHEHMLFKGTARRGVGEIAATVEACGGEINAWTSFDQTVYHVVLAAAETATGVDILADALRNSAFDATELTREIEVVVEEILRADDAPSRRVSKALFELAYQSHPYRRPVLGSEATVRGLDRDRVLDFFHGHYRPDRITLVAVGDVDAEALEEQVRAAFGDWRAAGAPRRTARAEEPAQAEPRTRVLVEDVPESRCAIAWHLPGVRHPDIPAADALAIILGHGDSSRLSREVRWRRELVNDVYGFAYTPRDPGLFMVGAGLKPGRVDEAIDLILDQVYRTRREPVTEDELERARVVLLAESAYQKETVQGEARKLGFYEVVAGDYAWEQAYTEQLQRLTPEDLRRVAQTYFTEAPSMVLQTPRGPATEVVAPAAVSSLRRRVDERFARHVPSKATRNRGAIDTVRVELENGAVLLVRYEPAPVLALRAAAVGGQRFEDVASAGAGNLFAALWGTATVGLPADAFARRVAMLGGSVSAFSGRNALGLRGEFIAEKAHDGLRLFCDALLEPRIEAADLDRERAAILQRIKNREDNGAAVAFDTFAAALYPTHPYGRPVTGSAESVRSHSRDGIVAHGTALAAPPRLVVAVVGSIDPDLAIDVLGERLCNGAPASERVGPPRDAPPAGPQRHHRELDKKQSHIVIGGRGLTLDDPDRYAVEVLTSILSGQSGRLFIDLRDRRGLAYSVACSALEGIDPGHVIVHMGTSPDKIDEALSGIYEHLERVQSSEVSEEELRRARRYLVGTHAIDLQRCGARAMTMALSDRFGLGYEHHTFYPGAIEAVTAADVQRVARRLLAPEGLLEVVAGPFG